MKTEMLSLPGYQMFDYLIVLQPHEQLRDRIMKIKKDFAEKFEAPSAEWGKPGIAIARFSQLKLMEDRLFNRLKTIALAMPAFKLELNNFESIPTHSIVLNVATQGGIQLLQKSLKPAQRLMQTKEQKPHFINNPGITIARQLLPWQFEKAWLEYSHKHFTGSFIADSMVLLKKPAGTSTYQPIQRFEFKNMPVLTTQGQLFA